MSSTEMTPLWHFVQAKRADTGSHMSFTNFNIAQLCYTEIKYSDWMLQVM